MQKKGRKVLSIRGVEVDFDLMEIKQQIASRPKTIEVKARENFIDKRLNRRMKNLETRLKDDLLKKERDKQDVKLSQPPVMEETGVINNEKKDVYDFIEEDITEEEKNEFDEAEDIESEPQKRKYHKKTIKKENDNNEV